MKLAARSRQALSLAAIGLAFAMPAMAQTVSPQAKKGGTLIHGHVSSIDHFDPAMFCTTVQLETALHMYESLVMMGEDYSAKPMLASKVDAAPDGRKFTFTLRQGVKFHNGKTMTSADVLATMQRYAKISTNAPAFAQLASFEAPDAHTFIINLKEPSPVLLDVMKTPCFPMSIIPAEEAAKGPRDITPIGTGPFRLQELVKDSHVTFRRFDDYTQDTSAPGPDGFAGRKTAHIETLRYNFLPEASSRIAAVQARTAHIAEIDAEQIDLLKGRNDIAVEKVFPGCMHTIIMRGDNGLTRDVKIRQAIAAVVDVEDMIAVSGSVTRLNPSLLYADSPFYTGEQMKPFYNEKNPAKARALLKEAGYKGEKIIIHTNGVYAYMRSQMLVLEQALKDVGVNVEMRVTDWVTNALALQTGEGGFNVSMTGFCSQPLLGPQQWRALIYTTTGLSNLKDADVDAPYARFFSSFDINERRKAWLEAETAVRSKAYMVKISDAGRAIAVNQRVKGWKGWYAMRNWDIWLD